MTRPIQFTIACPHCKYEQSPRIPGPVTTIGMNLVYVCDRCGQRFFVPKEK